MTKTSVLSPTQAVNLVWAATGKFSNDDNSRMMATNIPTREAIKDEAAASNNPNEIAYVKQSLTFMDAALRNIEIAYKGRELNFEENKKLREAYLENVKENIEFGTKANDILKSLPTMTISSAGGVTVVQAMAAYFNAEQFLNDNPIILWGIGLLLAGLGYFINLAIKRRSRTQQLMEYVKQDYERTLYYTQYLGRCLVILRSLYLDIDRVHKEIFRESYGDNVDSLISRLYEMNKPRVCPLIYKHMSDKKITPELWSMCDSGVEDSYYKCPLWDASEAKIQRNILSVKQEAPIM